MWDQRRSSSSSSSSGHSAPTFPRAIYPSLCSDILPSLSPGILPLPSTRHSAPPFVLCVSTGKGRGGLHGEKQGRNAWDRERQNAWGKGGAEWWNVWVKGGEECPGKGRSGMCTILHDSTCLPFGTLEQPFCTSAEMALGFLVFSTKLSSTISFLNELALTNMAQASNTTQKHV